MLIFLCTVVWFISGIVASILASHGDQVNDLTPTREDILMYTVMTIAGPFWLASLIGILIYEVFENA